MTSDELEQLTPDQKTIRIAEACGYHFTIEDDNGDEDWYQILRDPKGEYRCARRCAEDGQSKVGWGWHGLALSCLPHYLTDLNAMHEAEKLLKDSDSNRRWYGYCHALHKATHGMGEGADAPTRADAFLLAMTIPKHPADVPVDPLHPKP